MARTRTKRDTRARIAVCVGINYNGTPHQLNGCLNDVDDWSGVLKKNGFSVSTLTETEATLESMVLAFSNLVISLKDGDVGVITYSGHGTWVPDVSGDEDDGRDEALVPYNTGDDGGNLFLDDDMKLMFDKLNQGARLIFVSDCCHSGSAYRFMPSRAERESERRVRFLPPSHFILSDAMSRRMDRAFGQSAMASSAASTPTRGLVHFSGCKDAEYSNDARINGRYCGAFSYFATRAFEKGGTYQQVWQQVRRNLPSFEYQQTPLLNALPSLKTLNLYQ